MAKKKGRLLLIKMGDGADPEVFTTICALTTKSITINNEEIDITTPDCDDPGGAMWTEVIDGAKRLSFSGNGISKGRAEELSALEVALASTPEANLQVVLPNFGTFAARFFFQSFEVGGEQNGAISMSMSTGSTGPVTFTQEA